MILQDSSLGKVGEIKNPGVDRIKGLAGMVKREEMIMQQREFGCGAQPNNNILL